jgi:hypothetical protein
MNLMLNAKDLSKLSSAARAELAALLFPKDEASLPAGFDADDFEDVVDLTPGQVEDFMQGCAEVTIAGLKIIAEKGPAIHASLLDDAGIENYGHFQGSVTKRTRTITKDKNAFLFAWDNWQDAPDGIGHYAVTQETFRSLRIYFKLD